MTNPTELRSIYSQNFEAFCEFAFEELNATTSFLPNWHVSAMVHKLDQTMSGEIKRLLITLPPRYLKSHLVSIALPAFLLGRDPTAKIMCVSYGEALAAKLAADTERLMKSDEFRKIFPKFELAHKSGGNALETSQGGFRMMTSINGAATGLGCDVLIIDDPTKASASPGERQKTCDYVAQTLMSRLNSKEHGVVVVVGQRTHIDDVPGFLLDQGGWTHLNLAAIAMYDEIVPTGTFTKYVRKKGEALHPNFESLESLLATKAEIGSAIFLAQYQQAPSAPDGALLKEEWFPRYSMPYEFSQYEHIFLSIDAGFVPSKTSSPSAAVVVGARGDQCDLLHVWRDWVDIDALIENTERLIRKFLPSQLIVENTALGVPLLQKLHKIYDDGIFPMSTGNTSKEERAIKIVDFVSCGRLRLPKSAPWLSTLEQELFNFPSSYHNDQVDALVYALICIQREYSYRPLRLVGESFPFERLPGRLRGPF